MDIRVRRVLFVIFSLIFLIIAPALIFYAFGFRYNFNKRQVVKTGAMFIKSYPKDASIYLDDKLLKKNTPTQLTHLLPNNYEVKIVKEGYWPWEKNLTVQSQATTFIEDVALFKKDLEWQSLATGSFAALLLSPEQDQLALLKNETELKQLALYNLNDNKEKILYQNKTAKNLSLIAWCNSNKKFIAQQDNDFLIINPESEQVSSLYSLTKRRFNQVKCDYYNDNLIYGLSDQKLYQINLTEKTTHLLFNEPTLAFVPWKTKLLYVTTLASKDVLKSYFNKETQEILTLPIARHYQFIPSQKENLALLNTDEATAYLLEPFAEQPVKGLLQNVTGLKWYNDEQLLYWNKFELFAYYPKSQEKILLERSTTPILNAFWHPGLVYVFSQTAELLKIYELDSRDQRNIYDFLSLDPLTQNNLFINKKGDVLYLIANYDDQPGLYKMEIQ